MRIREAGDSALLLDVAEAHAPPLLESRGAPQPAGIDADVNVRAIAIARAVRQRGIAGVRDVVPTFRSVAVFFDPLSTDVAAVAAALHEDANTTLPESSARLIEVPVVYGGDAGPDLAHVAAFAGCRPEAVIERHASQVYRVFMLGFLPGFAYMASVDETIAMPRHRTPRLRVPAGSVGIAGRQTGIYPRDSPGGWQVIGRTEVNLFDTGRTPPALLAPGDAVRFVPVDAVNAFRVAPKPLGGARGTPRRPLREDSFPRGERDAVGAAEGRSVTVIRPGFLTTVQDAGRWGYQDLGVPVSGPMDYAAHRIANAVVGNPPDAAALEATWLGPELRMEQETQLAVAGGDLRAMLDGVELPLHAAVRCRAGSLLRFGDRRTGARAYIAFDGGIVVPPVLGSRATHVLSGLGGIDGRAVRAGDRIPLGRGKAVVPQRGGGGAPHQAGRKGPPYGDRTTGGARLRVLPGPQAEYFAPAALETLQRTRYTISPQSDRMGYRLAGGALAPGVIDGDMISDAAFMGAVQVPASGDPILLMADRQTSGGYPQLAVVITADLPRAAQLGPGDWVEFDVCSRADAIAALIDLEGKLLVVR